MRIMANNQISAVSMTTENSNYPATNLLNRHPRKYALSTASTTKITCTIGEGVGAFGLFNTNALEATITLKSGAGAMIASQFYDLSGIIDYWTAVQDITDLHYSIWFDYGDYYQSAVHTVEVDLDTTNPAAPVYAGVTFADTTRSFENGIEYGVTESLVDYSIVKELSNGSYYYRKRDVVKNFKCKATLGLSNRDFYTFINGIAQSVGPSPVACRLTDLNDIDWTIYGKLSSVQGSHDFYDHAVTTFDILEVV